MGQDVECAYLCDRVVDGYNIQWAQQLIEEGYLTEWVLDNLPGATSFVTVDRKRKYYSAGFKLGYKDYDVVTGKPTYYINNHFTMVVRWRKAPGSAGNHGSKVVTGFEVYTKSIDIGQRNTTGCPMDVSDDQNPLPLYIAPNTTDLTEKYPDSSYVPQVPTDLSQISMTIPYTYSVYFREEHEIEWANRWDLYFNDQEEGTITHWLAVVNSIIISSILGAVCMIIWIRTTSGDTKGRGDGILEEAKLRPRKRAEKKTHGLLEKEGNVIVEDDLSDDEATEDGTGWKLLHADVFRSPSYAGLLAPLIGSGMQLVFMTAGLLGLSCLGVLNPSWRGGFITVGIVLFFVAGGFSGYFSGRLYKTFGGQNYRKNTLMVSDTRSVLKKNSLTSSLDSPALSGPSFLINLLPQPLHLGSSIQHSAPLHHPPRSHLPLAPHPTPASPPRQLLRLLPLNPLHPPNPHKLHPTPNPH